MHALLSGPRRVAHTFLARGTDDPDAGRAAMSRRINGFLAVGLVLSGVGTFTPLLAIPELGVERAGSIISGNVFLVVVLLGLWQLAHHDGGKRLRLAAHAMVASTFVPLSTTLLLRLVQPDAFRGAVFAPEMWVEAWLQLLIPLLATYLVGIRAGIGWGVVAAALYVLRFLLASVWAVGGPRAPSPEAVVGLAAQLVVLGTILTLSALQRAATDRLTDTLEERVRTRTVQLETERDRLAAVLHSVGFGMLILGPDGNLEAVNAEAEQILGIAAGEGPELSSESLQARLPADVRSALTDAVRDGHPYEQEDVMLRRPDGSTVPVALVSNPIAHDGEAVGTVLAARDLTEARRLEAERQHASRLESMGRLAAGIAHEVNSPMHFIRGNVEFLRDSLRDFANALSEPAFAEVAASSGLDVAFLAEDVPSALQETVDGVERVTEIVQAVKTFSHPGNTAVEADLNSAVTAAVTLARKEVKSVAVVRFELAADLPRARLRVGDVQQAVLNLVVNAAHAIADSGSTELGTITVRTSHGSGDGDGGLDGDGNHVAVEVQDTGCGIPDDVMGRLFEPFFTTKEAGRGTGQGLAFVRETVTRHEGTITVESTPGRGSVFRLSFPAGEQEAAP